jgi:hypothetical protein
MSKKLTLITVGENIAASFTDYDSAVKEFKAMQPGDEPIALLTTFKEREKKPIRKTTQATVKDVPEMQESRRKK